MGNPNTLIHNRHKYHEGEHINKVGRQTSYMEESKGGKGHRKGGGCEGILKQYTGKAEENNEFEIVMVSFFLIVVFFFLHFKKLVALFKIENKS